MHKYNREYYLKNKGRIKEITERYLNKQGVKEKIKKYKARYYKKHRKKIREQQRVYFQMNKGIRKNIILSYQRKYRKTQLEKLKLQLLDLLDDKCFRCGYNEFICSLDIHHMNNQNRLNKETKRGSFYRLKALIREAEISPDNLKVLCSNCHRAVTSKRVEL